MSFKDRFEGTFSDDPGPGDIDHGIKGLEAHYRFEGWWRKRAGVRKAQREARRQAKMTPFEGPEG